MSLKNDAENILRYLSQFPTEQLITNERALNELNINQEEFSNALDKLNSDSFLDGGKTHLSLSNKGRTQLEKIQEEEIEAIYSTIFDDFEFTLFHFFHNRGGKIALDCIPQIIKDSVPEKKGINDMPLINYLFKKSNLFNETHREYELNDLGKQYYLNLLSKRKAALSNQENGHHYTTTINAGRNSVITTGNKNTINSINIVKGNLNNVEEELKHFKVATTDIREIIEILKIEKLVTHNGEFGMKTKSWLGKMMQKSIDGTWEVGIATAGGVLAEILKKYFGI